jgi:excisionase family DNA binding protein
MTKLLNFKEAAELLGISEVSVKRYIYRGIIPTVNFSKRMIRIPQDKLEAVIEAGGVDACAAKKGA